MTVWQLLEPEEQDQTIKLLIKLRLIRKRRTWRIHRIQPPDKVRKVHKIYEYKLTSPAELIISLEGWLRERLHK